jgi:hypothetical protein
MARTFPDDPLELAIPLGTTWEEQWQLTDDDGTPIDITGYHFRMMVRDRASGELLLTITDVGATPNAVLHAVEGQIDIKVDAETVQDISPTGKKRSTRWDAELYQPGSTIEDPPYVIPVVAGSAVFTRRQTFPVMIP